MARNKENLKLWWRAYRRKKGVFLNKSRRERKIIKDSPNRFPSDNISGLYGNGLEFPNFTSELQNTLKFLNHKII